MGNVPGKKVTNADAGDADHVGGNDWDDLIDYLNDVDKTGPVKINTETRFRDGKLKWRDSGNDHNYTHVFSNLAANRNVTWPLLTGDDQVTFDAHSSTLTNKTFDLKNNTFKHRTFSIIVFQDGGQTYAVKHDGTLVDSDADPDDVIVNALAELGTDLGGDLFISRGQYDLSSHFAGFDIPASTHVHLEGQTSINVPNGYTGYVFQMDNVGFGSSIDGYGFLAEQGSPARNYIGVKLHSTTSTGTSFCSIKDLYIYQAGTALQLISNGASAFVNSNVFQNIIIDGPKIAVDFQDISSGDIDGNMFMNVLIQADGSTTTNGFKNIPQSRNQFINCFCWDFTTGSEANIESGASDTLIVGGKMTGKDGTFIDKGNRTFILSGDNIPPSVMSRPDYVKTGAWYGSAQTDADGLLAGRLTESVVGTGSSGATTDSTGNYRTFDTGATINSIIGHRMSVKGLTRNNAAYYKTAIYLGQVTACRVFCGLISTTSAPASTSDVLANQSGVGLWFDSAVSANWKVMHNDGDPASTVDDTSKVAAATTLTPVVIYAKNDNMFRFVLPESDYTVDVTTNIPASTTTLGFYTQIENTTGSSKTMRCYYETIKNDK